MEKINWIEEYLEEALRIAWMEGHEPALKLLDRLLYEEPGYGPLHYTVGIIQMDYAENTKIAELHLRMAIKFNPELADSYATLGRLLFSEERLDEALEIYFLGLKAKKAQKSHLLVQVGKAYELKKKFKKAITHYRKALGHSAELWHCMTIEECIERCKRKQR